MESSSEHRREGEGEEYCIGGEGSRESILLVYCDTPYFTSYNNIVVGKIRKVSFIVEKKEWESIGLGRRV